MTIVKFDCEAFAVTSVDSKALQTSAVIAVAPFGICVSIATLWFRLQSDLDIRGVPCYGQLVK